MQLSGFSPTLNPKTLKTLNPNPKLKCRINPNPKLRCTIVNGEFAPHVARRKENHLYVTKVYKCPFEVSKFRFIHNPKP